MRLPAEWERQSGVQLTWPDESTPWYDLPEVQRCYARIAEAILRRESVLMVTADIVSCLARLKEIAKADNLPLDVDAIRFAQAPLNDTWARDHGGIAVWGDGGEKYLYDFVFNGWGLKFASDLDNQITRTVFYQHAFQDDVLGVDMRPFVLEGGSIDCDGAGTLMATSECLLSVNRNEYLSREEIEGKLKHSFGLRRVLWHELFHCLTRSNRVFAPWICASTTAASRATIRIPMWTSWLVSPPAIPSSIPPVRIRRMRIMRR